MINNNKSSGLPNIATWLLKEAFLANSNIVTDIINSSFESCKCPETWKIANVVPLQKEGNKQLVSHLRPVSLLPVQSKIIEKNVHRNIVEHLQNNDLLCKERGGFREGHSTVSTFTFQHLPTQTFQHLSSTLHFRDTYLACKGDWNNLQHIKCVIKSTTSFKALSKVHSILSYTLHCFVKVM